jgi:2-amino-4-hydroxy-6-hydroxymethyldihydropteridine diphosphokinase
MALPGPSSAFVALGSNLALLRLGDSGAETLTPEQIICAAFSELDQLAFSKLRRRSSIYKSPAWPPVINGAPNTQADYANAVVEINTELAPHALLECLMNIEQSFARHRKYGEQNAERTLDLDLLIHGRLQMDTERLTLPHPRMQSRAFVLVPLAEIAADLHVPTPNGPVAIGDWLAQMPGGDLELAVWN